MLDEKFIVEIDYEGKPEDKEAVIEKLKQKLYDDFGCSIMSSQKDEQKCLNKITIHNPCVFDVIEANSGLERKIVWNKIK